MGGIVCGLALRLCRKSWIVSTTMPPSTKPASFLKILLTPVLWFLRVLSQDPVTAGDDDVKGNLHYIPLDYSYSLLANYVLLMIFTAEMLLKNLAFTPW